MGGDNFSLIGCALFGASAAVMLWKTCRNSANAYHVYNCVALDLDGTSLNSKHEFSDRLKKVLHHLQHRGIRFCVCTGRSLVSVLPILGTLQLLNEVPVVVYNGSSSFIISKDFKINEKIFSTPHTEDNAELLLRFAEKIGLVAQYYLEDTGDVFAVPITEEHKRLLGMYAELTGRKQVIGKDYEEAKSRCAAAKILLLTNKADDLIALAEREFPPGKFNIIRGSPSPFFVEFLPANISKGSGLSTLCDSLNINIQGVVAFGDGAVYIHLNLYIL